MQMRPENPLSGAVFPASKEIVSTATCNLRVTPGWEVLAERSFLFGSGPWGPAPREGFHITRECQGNLHTAVLSRLLCRGEPKNLGLSELCSHPAGRTPWASTWILGLGSQSGIFLLGSPKEGQSSNCLQKASCCCFLPSARASFAPHCNIWQARGRPTTPCKGPMGGAWCPRPGDPNMAPGPLRRTPAASLPMGRTALTEEYVCKACRVQADTQP